MVGRNLRVLAKLWDQERPMFGYKSFPLSSLSLSRLDFARSVFQWSGQPTGLIAYPGLNGRDTEFNFTALDVRVVSYYIEIDSCHIS